MLRYDIPFVTNGFSHLYRFEEPIFIVRCIRSGLPFISFFGFHCAASLFAYAPSKGRQAYMC